MFENNDLAAGKQFSLTRMIYAVSGAVIVYKVLLVLGWYLLWKAKTIPWGFHRLDLWFQAVIFFFILALLIAIWPYRPKSELFFWDTQHHLGWLRSFGSGLVGGVLALVIASPLLWFGAKQPDPLPFMIADGVSLIGVCSVTFFVVALAACGEMVFRGIVLRTLVGNASGHAAILASGLLSASICPFLSFSVGMIIGIICAILDFRTRSLVAAISSNAVFTIGTGMLTLHRGLLGH